jgi:hypothetical protein
LQMGTALGHRFQSVEQARPSGCAPIGPLVPLWGGDIPRAPCASMRARVRRTRDVTQPGSKGVTRNSCPSHGAFSADIRVSPPGPAHDVVRRGCPCGTPRPRCRVLGFTSCRQYQASCRAGSRPVVVPWESGPLPCRSYQASCRRISQLHLGRRKKQLMRVTWKGS